MKHKMNIQNAIEILTHHQEWRIGKRDDMVHPSKITESLGLLLTEVKKLQQHSVSGKQPTEFSTEEVIDIIRNQYIEDYGSIGSMDNSERDGYWLVGFVTDALKAACVCSGSDKTT